MNIRFCRLYFSLFEPYFSLFCLYVSLFSVVLSSSFVPLARGSQATDNSSYPGYGVLLLICGLLLLTTHILPAIRGQILLNFIKTSGFMKTWNLINWKFVYGSSHWKQRMTQTWSFLGKTLGFRGPIRPPTQWASEAVREIFPAISCPNVCKYHC